MRAYVEEGGNKRSELVDGDLGGAIDGSEDDVDGLADELVDLRDSTVDDTLDVVDNGGEDLDGAVAGLDELCRDKSDNAWTKG